MNAYELAKEMDDACIEFVGDAWIPIFELVANMLRQQADRIDKLEREAVAKNNYLEQHCEKIDQQADRIAELEKDFAWAKDQWNKNRICFESRRNELEKDLALKTRDRDVFSNFTLAYEERIAELEKGGCGNCHACLVGVMENGYPVTMQRMIVCPDCGNKRCPKASNHRHQCTGSNEPNQRGSIYTTPQTKPLSNDEIREIGDDCVLKNNGILNWIEFARAIEERHGIK